MAIQDNTLGVVASNFYFIHHLTPNPTETDKFSKSILHVVDWLLECRIHNGYFWFKKLLRFLCNFWCRCWINSISEQRDDTSLHNLHSRSCVYTPLQSINRIRDPSHPQLSHHCSTGEEVIRSMALSFIEMNRMV